MKMIIWLIALLLSLDSWCANESYSIENISLPKGIDPQIGAMAFMPDGRLIVSFNYGKVFITSEGELPKEIEEYRIKLAPEKIHSVLYYAKLFYGESATMASESAVLGTPAIYIDNDGRGYTDEQESKYGLVANYKETQEDQKKSILKAIEILSSYNQSEWDAKRTRLLKDKIDVTNFLIDKVIKIQKET